jgi:hypothetical protein
MKVAIECYSSLMSKEHELAGVAIYNFSLLEQNKTLGKGRQSPQWIWHWKTAEYGGADMPRSCCLARLW